MNDIRRREKVTGSLFTGLMLIGMGVLFFLDQMEVADFGDVVRRYWPMILVLIGVAKLLDRKFWAAFWMIGIGAWLQIAGLGLFGLTINDSWPVVLILVGVGMMGRALFDVARRREPEGPRA